MSIVQCTLSMPILPLLVLLHAHDYLLTLGGLLRILVAKLKLFLPSLNEPLKATVRARRCRSSLKAIKPNQNKSAATNHAPINDEVRGDQ